LLYIIIGIIAILIVIFLIKHILFNPWLNSIINIVGFIALIVLVWNTPYKAASVVFVIAIIDCIRDILLADELYTSVSDEIDKTYAKKSILGILTLGLARVVFLLVLVPRSYIKASADVIKAWESGCPIIPCAKSWRSNYYYYYGKKIKSLKEQGLLVSNEETMRSEMKKSNARLNKMYPEKLLGKIADAVAGDKEMKQRRNDARKKISFDSNIAYINSEIYKKYPQAITEAMTKRSVCSPEDIKNFEELKTLHLNEPLGAGGNTTWAVYFIIQALQPLVESGEFSDEILNDNDALDNHAYQYVKSEVQMNSIDGNANPLLALEDDDDD